MPRTGHLTVTGRKALFFDLFTFFNDELAVLHQFIFDQIVVAWISVAQGLSGVRIPSRADIDILRGAVVLTLTVLFFGIHAEDPCVPWCSLIKHMCLTDDIY